MVEAACGEAVLTVEVSLIADAEAEAVAVDGYTVTLPAPEQAEEPADSVEEPAEPADEAEEPEDDAGFDIEIMSEAVGARKEIPVSSSLLNFSYAEYEWVHGVFLTTGFTVTSSFFSTYPDIDGLFVIAKSGSIRYYLHYYPKSEISPDSYNYPYFQDPVLPVGSYDLLMGGLTADGNLVVTQPLGAKLIVLPTPEVSLGAPFDDSRHFFNLKLPKDTTGIEGLITPLYNLPLSYMLSEAVNGVFSSDVLDDGETYSFMYAGPDTTEYDTTDPDASDPNLIMLSNPAWLTIPKTTAPGYLDAYFPTGDPGDPYIGESVSDPLILRYKGATAQIETDFDTSVDDTRLTYKSSDKKVVTVDEVGNVTAVGAGDAIILVTSMGDNPLAFDTVYVKVEPVTPKTFRFDQTKGVPDYGRKPEINDKYNYYSHLAPTYTLLLTTDSIPSDAQIPVTFTVTGGEGLKIFQGHADGAGHWPSAADNFANYKSTYTTTITTLGDPPRAQIHLMAVGGGHYTVTAEALGKTATCTIDVDGFSSVGYQAYPSDSAQFYRGGKTVTGWITWHGYEEQFIYGAGGLKPDPECGLAGRHIFYVSPSTKQVIGPGVQKIGSKYYCFDDSYYSRNSIQTCLYDLPDWHTVDGMDSTQNPYTGSLGHVYIAADGHLLTGWQEVDTDDDGLYDTVRYFDPSTYFMAENTWVPVRNGKGVTWVNSDGEQWDDRPYTEHNGTLDNAGAAYQDGFHEISGEWYYFAGGYKKGARQTGWVYVKKDGSNWVPADAKTGTAKIYCDPDRNGAVAMSLGYGETFWADGKEYCGDYSAYGYCIVLLPGPYTGKTDVKYLETGAGYILGPDGSIAKNALVHAYYTPDGGGFFYAYVDADGRRVKQQWVTIKGKIYYFDAAGELAEAAIENTDETGFTRLYVWDDADYSQVAAIPVKAGKPQEGYAYYYNGKKLTNIVLFSREYSEYFPAAILDKSGKMVSGVIASGKTAVGSSATETYIVDQNGSVVCKGWPEDDHLYYTVEVKGKLYATLPRTGKILKGGLVPIAWNWHKEVAAFGYADKNGVLARNTFKDVPDFGTVYLDEDGVAAYTAGDPLIVKGKAYLTDTATYHYGTSFTDISVVQKRAKAGWETYDFGTSSHPMVRPVYVNKDGSFKTGFLTLPDGKKAYYTVRGGTAFYALGCWNQAPYPTLWKIDGKLYLFNEHKEQVTGWVHFDKVLISDLASETVVTTVDDALLYFDPKTGAALAGGWKNAPLPLVYYDYDIEGYTLSFGAEDIGVPEEHGNVTRAVNASDKTAKLYFDADGVLARDTELSIGGKAYLFSHDGTSALKAGWTDANKMYYALKNGSLATGRQKIDGQYYCFDGAGRRVSNALLKTGSKWYYYDMHGVQATPVLSGSPPTSFKQAYIGSVDGTALTAVWAKDGSLSKIVYTGSGKAAAGECVNFGSWDPSFGIYNVFCLDSKGLPMTGAVTVLEPDGSDYVSRTYLFNADGTRVRADSKDCNSLVLYGKQFYVMDGELVQTQSKLSAVIIDGSWDTLSDADRKTMGAYCSCYLGHDSEGGPSIRVLVNPDGSVAGSQAISATVDGRTRLWHTDRFGIPMEYYTPLFKFGGKWYWDAAAGSTMSLDVPGEEGLLGIVRTRSGGELVGVYSEQTGKAISGSFIVNSPGGLVKLKNGKPQTGTVTPAGGYGSYYLDPEMGLYPVNWC